MAGRPINRVLTVAELKERLEELNRQQGEAQMRLDLVSARQAIMKSRITKAEAKEAKATPATRPVATKK